MAKSDEILRKTTEILSTDAAKKEAERTQLERERRELVSSIGNDVVQALSPVLKNVAEAIGKQEDVFINILKQIRVEAPTIPEVRIPNINVPRPNVTVKAPDVKAPIVNIPKADPINFPESMSVTLDAVDKSKPLPVMMMDTKGRPMAFSSGGGGGKRDFITIKDIRNSSGASAFNADGELRTSASVSVGDVTVSQDYGSGEIGSETVRMVMATDAIASVNIVAGSSSGTEYTEGDTDTSITGTAIMGDTGDESGNLWAVALGSGAISSNSVRVVQATDAVASTSIVDALPAGTNAIGKLAANSGVDIGDVDILGGTIDTLTTITNDVSIDDGGNSITVDASDLDIRDLDSSQDNIAVRQVSGANWSTEITNTITETNSAAILADTASIDTSTGNAETSLAVIDDWDATHDSAIGSDGATVMAEAHTANPTAVADGDAVRLRANDVGNLVTRPVQVRDLTQTAFAAVTNGTETTLLAGASGIFHDLVYVLAANHSDAAVQVDFRQTTGGTIQLSLDVPANSTAGVAPAVPIPQDHADSTWTVDLADDTQDCDITALFSKEV
jgi:hypothetical protein